MRKIWVIPTYGYLVQKCPKFVELMPFQAKNICRSGPTDDISDLDTAKMSLMQIVNKKNKIFIIQTKIV